MMSILIEVDHIIMIPDERKERLLELLKKEKFLSAKEIAQKLFISEPTARRDINNLSELKLANKVYGGISYIEQNTEDFPTIIRNTKNFREKVSIAKKASSLIKDGMNIFIHNGTTCLRLIDSLNESINLNVLTDDIRIAYGLAKFPNIKVELTPGFLRQGYDCVYGSQTSNYIKKRNADLFFFSCHTFNFTNSAMTCNEKDIDIVNSFIQNSKETILLIDHSKFNKTSFFQLCDLSKIDRIVSDYKPTQDELEICHKNEIQFLN